jgi:glutamate-1-semialdehyde 2,1-aminomutase
MSLATASNSANTAGRSTAVFDTGEYLRRAERVIPQGASAGGRPLFRDVITRSQGAHLWNAHGKQYVDHLLAYGPIVLGHADPHVNDAVKGTIDQVDLNWVGPQAGEVELSERLVRLIPSAEKVVLVNTGTDALQHALHVVRAATGRRRILKFHGHYHGWAGELGTGANFDVEPGHAPAPEAPNSAGAIAETAADVIVVDWNDAEAVRAAFQDVGHEIAAVFTEPYLHSYTNAAPAPGFLELLRELTSRSGSLLVFDEVKTGFRHHLGGYQSVIGVTPDLTALGKALGNGYTIAALVGRADLMDLLGSSVTVDGTYYANPYASAAALATLDQLEAGGVQRLWDLGQRLRDGLAAAITDSGVPANVTGIGSGWIINWRAEPPVTFREAVDADLDRGEAFRAAMLDAGIVLPPYVITDARICVAFTDHDIDATIDAARYALASVR